MNRTKPSYTVRWYVPVEDSLFHEVVKPFDTLREAEAHVTAAMKSDAKNGLETIHYQILKRTVVSVRKPKGFK